MPVGDGQGRQGRAVVELERSEGDRLEATGPQSEDRPPRSHGSAPLRSPPSSEPTSAGHADELAVGRVLGRRGRQRLLEVGDEVVDVLETDRQPDEVLGRPGRDLLLRVSCECVVDAGWMISDLASPTFASSEKIWTLSMSRRPASTPPLTPNVTTPP